MRLSEAEARLLSRLLFEARERVDMAADVVEARTGKHDIHGRRLVEQLDELRAKMGWSAHGFGGERATFEVSRALAEPSEAPDASRSERLSQ